jgi:nickel/cobalt transporter (NicO) family protein
MRRTLALAVVLFAVIAAPAAAHPLGNFSINHLAEVSVSADRVDVRYILDEAEIPTFQQRGVADAELVRRKTAEVQRGLVLTVDGRRVPLRTAGRAALSHPTGAGGLRTTRLELPLMAGVKAARRVALHDGTFPGRVGWHAIVARPGRGTGVRSSVPAGDPTGGLRRYPEDALSSPADVRDATLAVGPGDGTLEAPDGRHGERGGGSREDPLSRAFSSAAAGDGVLVLLLLTAFAWGALHALSPGHGKAMVAAYLVGARGTPRHAVALGATVTITHTAGVFALGLVALALSEYVLPEDLYPWLNLVSGLLVLVVGASVLRSHLRRRRHRHRHHHEHSHAPPDRLSWRGLVAMGASAGLIPCPSALVVLLGAVAQGQIALGMLLIVAFSLGLATTLTALGVAVVLAGRALGRLDAPAWLGTAVPALSALLIVGVGFVLTVQAVPQIA